MNLLCGFRVDSVNDPVAACSNEIESIREVVEDNVNHQREDQYDEILEESVERSWIGKGNNVPVLALEVSVGIKEKISY